MIATIGGFDGMHLGHQALIQKAQKLIVIEKGSNLTPGDDRCDYTNLPCVFYNLDEIKHLSAKEFIEILKSQNITKIVVGDDFRFGYKRSGDINVLQKYFDVEIVSEIKIDGVGVHSRIIREFLKEGNIKKANRFLGHTYKIKGAQIKGQGLGSKELVPTINITPIKNYLIPKTGVYITLTNSLPSLTFIGVRSTDNNFSIETHILTENGQWKMDNEKWTMENGNVQIEFLEYLRENRKFENLKELKKQIEEDIKKAKSLEINRNSKPTK